METDRRLMQIALDAATGGAGRVHPNPLVGAVVVRDGAVVGTGYHAEFGGVHAEVAALHAAGDHARGATLYVTLEPCAHHGKQPPCVDAIISAGIARVVFALADPDPVAAGGAARLRTAGVTVDAGTGEDAAREQNFRFLHRFADQSRPWVGAKLATSIDGMIADHRGDSRWISDDAARAWVHRLRAGVGGIGIGAVSAARDGARLTVRGDIDPRVAPVRVVFDRRGTLPLAAPILADGGPPVTVLLGEETRRAELERAGARVHIVDSLAAGLNALASDGVDSLLVEGGGRLVSALLDADLVDRVYLVQAPIWLGRGVPAWSRVREFGIGSTPRWRRRDVAVSDSDDRIQMFEPL